MPTYSYICMKCEHEWERVSRIAAMDEPLSEPCPECKETGSIEKRIYHAPLMADSVRMGIRKPDNNFKDVLRRIHERSPGSQLDKTSTIVKL